MKSRCPQDWFLLEALKEIVFHASFLLGYLQSLAVLGLQVDHTNLCLHLHMAFFSVCVYFSVYSHDVLIRKLVISFGVTLTDFFGGPVFRKMLISCSSWIEHDIILTIYICEDPISK